MRFRERATTPAEEPTEPRESSFARQMREMDEQVERFKARRPLALAALPPFVEDTTCPKCAWPGIGITHKPEDVSGWGIQWEHEHILRTCTRCGYTWKERPLDAEETS